MIGRARLILFGVLLLAVVVIDFKLMMMSIASDLLFAGLAVGVLWPIIKKEFTE